METTTSKPVEKKPCNKKLWGALGFIACVGGTVVSACAATSHCF